MFTAVGALSVGYPASVQAVPTTYYYTGNPFTSGVKTMSFASVFAEIETLVFERPKIFMTRVGTADFLE